MSRPIGAGRFAPSPSADLHIGNLRTAVLAWLFARSTDRRFLIRVDDLDDRTRADIGTRQVADLAAIGLTWDEPPEWQTQHPKRYDEAIARLAERELLYECYCSRKDIQQAPRAPHAPQGAYPGTCRDLSEAEREARRAQAGRPPALRLRAGVTSYTVHDLLHGDYTGVVDDLVVRRGDGVPAYNLSVVIDDATQGVDQVVRGDDLLPSSPRQAYLDIEQLVRVAREHGADAIHPGYGFLSENPAFAEACASNGLTFIGPPASSMRAMGDKVEARRRMIAAAVPVVPGTAALADEAAAVVEAKRIGYPVMVKAAAGGGGIGMRVAKGAEDLPAAFEACRRAAQSSFGSPDVYLERYLEHPRHIEMQVLADDHGTTVALGERECSIQRRHQKLLEETPAVGLTPSRRRAMAEAAVKAASAVQYRNAGTIEFIVSGEEFYFLEMNTRLQVEHPVTESVLGIDLVREQIRIARGERIPEGGYPEPRGHAIEFRINAEDPLRNFMPTPRRVQRYAPPSGPGVRVDSGIRPHQEISPHFDSLLLKLIVLAHDRESAIGRGRRALQEFVLTGPKTTIPFHRALLEERDFINGRISTSFIQDHPSLVEKTREFDAQHSPFESLYGAGEVAAAIAAGVVLSGDV